MADSFTLTSQITVTPSDGPNLSKTLASQGFNGKELSDEIRSAGVHDLAALLAPIAEIRGLLILAAGDGFKVDFDGLGASARVMKTCYLEVSDVSGGALDLEITAVGADQRIRVMGYGDPS